MLRRLLPIGTMLAFAVALILAPQAEADAKRSKHQNHYSTQNVPPGLQTHPHQRWIPPGQLKKMQREHHHRYRYQAPTQRYTPPKYRSYDRDREDYGLIIRKGPRGTTVEVEYHRRHR